MTDIATLCEQIHVEPEYIPTLEAEVEDAGYLKKSYYFKRVSGGTAEYLFTEGIGDGELTGTYYVNIPNRDVSNFEKLLEKATYYNYGDKVPFILVGALAGFLLAIKYIGIPYFKDDAAPGLLVSAAGAILGGVVANAIHNFFSKHNINSADEKIKRNHLSNYQHSESSFDPKIIQYALHH